MSLKNRFTGLSANPAGEQACWHHHQRPLSRRSNQRHSPALHSSGHSLFKHTVSCSSADNQHSAHRPPCSVTSPSTTLQQVQHPAAPQQQSNISGTAAEAALQQHQLHWWPSHRLELQQLEQHVAQLLRLAKAGALEPGVVYGQGSRRGGGCHMNTSTAGR